MQMLKNIKTPTKAWRQDNSQKRNQKDAVNTTPAPAKKLMLTHFTTVELVLIACLCSELKNIRFFPILDISLGKISRNEISES